MPRYFVIWCLDETVEDVIDAVEEHGRPVHTKLFRDNITRQVSGSSEIEIEVGE